MFERFTDRARQVVVLAQEEARVLRHSVLRHNYIGTEHILLGLVREGGAAARALDGFDVTLEEVQGQVARIIGQGDEVTTGQIPFTPRAKKVLELSLREALDNSESYIGPEHILLGLLREGAGLAVAAGRPREERGSRSQLSTLAPEVIEELMLRAAGRRKKTLTFLAVGWLLFAVALGIGVLIG